MSGDLLVTFNAGSSTVKIGLFAIETNGARRLASAAIDFRQTPLSLQVTAGQEKSQFNLESASSDELDEVLAETFALISTHVDLTGVAAIGHRVVHGGDLFDGPVAIDDEVIRKIDALTVLAPLHQPQSLRLIRAIRKLRPEIVQTASFDTAFHRTYPDVVRRFAIPRALHDAGIKRYGFHGLSYKFIAGELARRAPALGGGKVVTAHLGSGASLCAMDGGLSRDSSMSFSTLDGIPMATRCGALDPGVLLHLLGSKRCSLSELEDILYHQSGLLGMSGISADSRALLESDRPEAREAIDVFTFRIAGEIGRLAVTLGGLDAIVFTAGIGEHQPQIRAAVCERLAWTGLALDPEANNANARTISEAGSRVSVLVIPTDEEQVLADEAIAVLQRS